MLLIYQQLYLNYNSNPKNKIHQENKQILAKCNGNFLKNIQNKFKLKFNKIAIQTQFSPQVPILYYDLILMIAINIICRRIIQRQQKYQKKKMDRQAILKLLEVTDEDYSFQPYKCILSLKNKQSKWHRHHNKSHDSLNAKNIPYNKIRVKTIKNEQSNREKLKIKLKTIQRETSPEGNIQQQFKEPQEIRKKLQSKSLHNIVSTFSGKTQKNRYGLRMYKINGCEQKQKENQQLRQTIKKKFKQKKLTKVVNKLNKINNFLEGTKIPTSKFNRPNSVVKRKTYQIGKSINTLTYLLS